MDNSRTALRNINDKDGRGRKDFLPVNMDLLKFTTAFREDGYFWIWGCVFTATYFQVIHQIIKTIDWKTKLKSGGLKVSFYFDEASAKRYYPHDIFFPSDVKTKKFERDFSEINAYFERVVYAVIYITFQNF